MVCLSAIASTQYPNPGEPVFMMETEAPGRG